MDNFNPSFRDGQAAFKDAIKTGRLSLSTDAVNYAGHYMYMHTENGRDLFKQIHTREYLA